LTFDNARQQQENICDKKMDDCEEVIAEAAVEKKQITVLM